MINGKMNNCTTHGIHSAMLEKHLLTSEHIIIWDEKEHYLNGDILCARKFKDFQNPYLISKLMVVFGYIRKTGIFTPSNSL